jgi:transcription elongation factor Elf1
VFVELDLGVATMDKYFMATKTSPFKRAIKAAKQAMAGQRYGAHDKPFRCPFCGHDQFKPGPNVNLLMMHTLACADCGHVEFFVKTPTAIET